MFKVLCCQNYSHQLSTPIPVLLHPCTFQHKDYHHKYVARFNRPPDKDNNNQLKWLLSSSSLLQTVVTFDPEHHPLPLVSKEEEGTADTVKKTSRKTEVRPDNCQ